MRILRYITLSLLLSGTYSHAADTVEPVNEKPTALTRAGSFVTKLFTTMKTLTDDVVPLVKAADEELARQWRADWPAIQEEIRQLLRAAVPGHASKSDSPR
jgi:hypothetical protein